MTKNVHEQRIGCRLAAIAIGALAALAAPTAYAESGKRVCYVEQDVQFKKNFGSGPNVVYRFGMAVKVFKGDSKTCSSKLNWMLGEMARLGPAASAKLSYPNIDADWRRSDTRVSSTFTTRLDTCEQFSYVFQSSNRDECLQGLRQTESIYAVGGGGGSRVRWYHY